MEDIQCSSEAGTQGHTAPIPNQKTSAGRPVQLECIRAFIWPNVHCPGVDTMLLVHIQKLLGCLCLESHWCLLLQQLHKTKCAIHQMVPHRHCIQSCTSLAPPKDTLIHAQDIRKCQHPVTQLCLACAAAYAVLSYDPHKTPRKQQLNFDRLSAIIVGGGCVSDLLWPLLLPSAGTLSVSGISWAAHTHPLPPTQEDHGPGE